VNKHPDIYVYVLVPTQVRKGWKIGAISRSTDYRYEHEVTGYQREREAKRLFDDIMCSDIPLTMEFYGPADDAPTSHALVERLIEMAAEDAA